MDAFARLIMTEGNTVTTGFAPIEKIAEGVEQFLSVRTFGEGLCLTRHKEDDPSVALFESRKGLQAALTATRHAIGLGLFTDNTLVPNLKAIAVRKVHLPHGALPDPPAESDDSATEEA